MFTWASRDEITKESRRKDHAYKPVWTYSKSSYEFVPFKALLLISYCAKSGCQATVVWMTVVVWKYLVKAWRDIVLMLKGMIYAKHCLSENPSLKHQMIVWPLRWVTQRNLPYVLAMASARHAFEYDASIWDYTVRLHYRRDAIYQVVKSLLCWS